MGDTEQGLRRAGISQQIPVRDRLERDTEASPTLANATKPRGVRRSRKQIMEKKEAEKEDTVLEKKLSAFLQTFPHQLEMGNNIIRQHRMRTEAMKSASDDLVLMADTSRMSPEILRVFRMRQQEATDNIIARKRFAREQGTAAAAAVASAAEVAAAQDAIDAEEAAGGS